MLASRHFPHHMVLLLCGQLALWAPSHQDALATTVAGIMGGSGSQVGAHGSCVYPSLAINWTALAQIMMKQEESHMNIN